MGRLSAAPSRLSNASARIRSVGAGPDRLKFRDQTVHWRKWYNTAEWRRLRRSVLVEELFTCRRCGIVCDPSPENRHETNAPIADHRIPHRGDRDLFFDRNNLQCLCKGCHDGAKQAEERAGR